MSKKQFNELELQFQEECEVINLKYEYDGYNGDISWAIISNLTEDEILENLPLPSIIEPEVPQRDDVAIPVFDVVFHDISILQSLNLFL